MKRIHIVFMLLVLLSSCSLQYFTEKHEADTFEYLVEKISYEDFSENQFNENVIDGLVVTSGTRTNPGTKIKRGDNEVVLYGTGKIATFDTGNSTSTDVFYNKNFIGTYHSSLRYYQPVQSRSLIISEKGDLVFSVNFRQEYYVEVNGYKTKLFGGIYNLHFDENEKNVIFLAKTEEEKVVEVGIDTYIYDEELYFRIKIPLEKLGNKLQKHSF